jgi:hypothetical protein
MLTCPLCKTTLPAPTPRCPRCQTDLSLLADFVTDLKTLLDKADAHRRAGEIAPAVQTYLDVLEVDPTNAEAREALGPVLRAVWAAESVGRPQQRYAIGLMGAVLFLIVCCVFFAGAGWAVFRGW